MIIMGVDYSLNSPACCVIDSTKPGAYFQFYANKKSQIFGPVRVDDFVFLGKEPTEERGMARYIRNASLVAELAQACKVKQVILEGYSYGSKSSSLFQIAENGGILKYFLNRAQYDVEVVAPQSVKKFATGKGNVDKSAMYKAWKDQTGVDLEKLLACKPDANPLTDIVDSYFIAKQFLAHNR